MFHDFAPRLAQILTEYSNPIQKGDHVAIFASTAAEPLIVALYEAILRRGGNPVVYAKLDGLDETFYRLAQDDQLDFSDPVSVYMIEQIDAFFSIISPFNTMQMAGVDTARMARRQRARRPFMEKYFQRINEHTVRWNITAWPTQASAQEAEMGLLAYTEFVYKACGLDQPDPIAYWTGFKDRQERLAAWLAGKHRAEVRGPGIDLSFDFSERPWVSCHGTVNFPDGEIFTSPIEDSVNGTVSFSYPTDHYGRKVDGIRLTFKDGKVIEAHADKGEDVLLSQLEMDEGAKRLGEFAIGTNMGIQQFTGDTLFDEKIGGTVHMALGEGIEESGGVNKSAIHWDIVHSMRNGGEVLIDGKLFYRNGEFVIGK